MPDPAPNAELLRSLGRLVRGLSALFWGLPAALVICVGTASAGWFRAYGMAPALAVMALLFFGVWQLGHFQKQERPWRNALDLALLLSLINTGLSPFLYWWSRVPDQPVFSVSIRLLAASGLLFVWSLNIVLRRLGEMLPDETLRQETRQFTALNRLLLVALLALLTIYLVVLPAIQRFYLPSANHSYHFDLLDTQVAIPILGLQFNGAWLLWLVFCLLALLPIAMTMALLWKTKEVILDSVFGGK